MNDFQKSVHRKDPASYEQIQTHGIEKDKKGKEEAYTGLPTPSPKSVVFAVMVSFFKKFISIFTPKGRSELIFFDQQQMVEDLIAFRKLLHILSHDDQSHNPEYTQQLSELWHNLLDDCNSILATSSNPPESLAKLKKFITEVHHYPPHEDHTLGYYFSAYAGQEWLPFPFMEMLEALHVECNERPQEAMLTRWIGELTEILALAGHKEVEVEGE